MKPNPLEIQAAKPDGAQSEETRQQIWQLMAGNMGRSDKRRWPTVLVILALVIVGAVLFRGVI